MNKKPNCSLRLDSWEESFTAYHDHIADVHGLDETVQMYIYTQSNLLFVCHN